MRLIANKTIKDLTRLIDINLEILSGYKLAAEVIKDQNFREVFIIYIQRLSEYINELKHIGKDLSGNINNFYYQKKNLSFLHSNADEITILKMCKNLEEKSIKEYEVILDDKVPSNIEDVLLKQYNGIKDVRIHLRSLEEKY